MESALILTLMTAISLCSVTSAQRDSFGLLTGSVRSDNTGTRVFLRVALLNTWNVKKVIGYGCIILEVGGSYKDSTCSYVAILNSGLVVFLQSNSTQNEKSIKITL